MGARYTALADACPTCASEDTDQLLPLDHPDLVHPPHPGCERGECRCMLVYQYADETPPDS